MVNQIIKILFLMAVFYGFLHTEESKATNLIDMSDLKLDVSKYEEEQKILKSKIDDCAINKNTSICIELGDMYHKGKNVTKNEEKSRFFYFKAYFFGNNDGLRVLCDHNYSSECILMAKNYEKGEFIEKNYLKALEYHKKSCGLNAYSSCFEIGEYYRKGDVVKIDHSKAEYYYNKACNGDKIKYCSALGNLYKNGKIIKKNYEKAMVCYKKACTVKNGEACYNIALLYKQGLGTKKSIPMAEHLFGRACDYGYFDGCKEYKKINDY